MKVTITDVKTIMAKAKAEEQAKLLEQAETFCKKVELEIIACAKKQETRTDGIVVPKEILDTVVTIVKEQGFTVTINSIVNSIVVSWLN